MIDENQIRRLERAERMARLMDRAFRVPGTSIRFGWDSILGLVPGVGDTVALIPSLYILGLAHGSGASTGLLAKMVWNMILDWFIGLFPLVGDLLDVGFKANIRNARLLREHLESLPA
ncbi:MAG: DUF4112 domain-containing protein [Donghicola eburneus]|nr:DUF4112 domain-containing protein [Donghicola eburneus]MCI5038924.1 DUF4112 domain-containing protein [Donghicola eburneus]